MTKVLLIVALFVPSSLLVGAEQTSDKQKLEFALASGSIGEIEEMMRKGVRPGASALQEVLSSSKISDDNLATVLKTIVTELKTQSAGDPRDYHDRLYRFIGGSRTTINWSLVERSVNVFNHWPTAGEGSLYYPNLDRDVNLAESLKKILQRKDIELSDGYRGHVESRLDNIERLNRRKFRALGVLEAEWTKALAGLATNRVDKGRNEAVAHSKTRSQ